MDAEMVMLSTFPRIMVLREYIYILMIHKLYNIAYQERRFSFWIIYSLS